MCSTQKAEPHVVSLHEDVRRLHLKQFHSHIMVVAHHLTRSTYDPVMANP